MVRTMERDRLKLNVPSRGHPGPGSPWPPDVSQLGQAVSIFTCCWRKGSCHALALVLHPSDRLGLHVRQLGRIGQKDWGKENSTRGRRL